MKNKSHQVINVLRPKDKSLEAYRAWMKGIASQLAPEAEIAWTEEQWIEKLERFLAKTGKAQQ